MHEVDHINSLSDVPDNISNLLKELKEFKEDFNIEVEYCKDRYKITLRESTVNRRLNTTRCILMVISENPCSYSIHLFTKHLQNSSKRIKKNLRDRSRRGKRL